MSRALLQQAALARRHDRAGARINAELAEDESADARHDESSVPKEVYDWQNYGGITRPVYLIEVPETFIHSSCV